MASFFDNKARAANAAAASSLKAKDTVTAAPRAQPWVEKYRLVLGDRESLSGLAGEVS
jgi:hypothetical protein